MSLSDSMLVRTSGMFKQQQHIRLLIIFTDIYIVHKKNRLIGMYTDLYFYIIWEAKLYLMSNLNLKKEL